MPVKLDDVVAALEAIAPLEYAAEWDNVGLLIEPARARAISRVMLTIDLTHAVAAEALSSKAELVVAYHPPIFESLRCITGKLAALVERRVAVYSPHTALDAAPGGVNDWLAQAFKFSSQYVIEPHRLQDWHQRMKLVVFIPRSHVDALRLALSGCAAGRIGHYSQCSFNVDGVGTFEGDEASRPVIGVAGRLETVDEVRLEMVCPDFPDALQEIGEAIRDVHPYEEPAWELYRLEPKPSRRIGQGRDIALTKPTQFQTILRDIKRHLGLRHVRAAIAQRHQDGKPIERVALCPGAGGSVLAKAPKGCDLLLTGEMRHHDILAANERGTSVVLTDHTHSERGYLPTLKNKLREKLDDRVKIDIAKCDREPLRIV